MTQTHPIVPPRWKPFVASWKKDCAEILRTGRDPSFSLDQITEKVISLREQKLTYAAIAEILPMGQRKIYTILKNHRPDLIRKKSGDAIK